MSLVVNHNMMAANVARNLNAHYSNLSTSTQRLSTGMRINSAADDAAGLAISELQRADIAALQQGARNANDAISLIQTADGAMGVIDEKLIRMKELAEQAATGTYDSTQRLMIESEYQQMASEITRIANATDFNGIKLLDGTLSGVHDGSKMEATGALKVHFGTSNDSAEDYYYIEIGDVTAQALGLGSASTWDDALNRMGAELEKLLRSQIDKSHLNSLEKKSALEQIAGIISGPDSFTEILDSIAKNATWLWNAGQVPTMRFDEGGKSPGYDVPTGDIDNMSERDRQKRLYAYGRAALYNIANLQNNMVWDDINGGWRTLNGAEFTWGLGVMFPHFTDTGNGMLTGDALDEANAILVDSMQSIAARGLERYDYAGMSISAQEDAQLALDAINNAIIEKDKVRAHLGAIQNRLENTITNLNVQAENLQAAESRIRDVDVATEMTEFTRQQILTQTAVAMLSQANSLPQMAMQLVGG